MYRIIIAIFILFCKTSFGQTHKISDRAVDSVEFITSRAQLNSLSTEPFQKRNYHSSKTDIPYRFLLPKGFDAKEKYPLVITFHNSSRIGTDNETQLEPLARTWLREEIYDQYRCFVLAPHFGKRSSNYTPNKDSVLFSTPSQDVHELLTLITKIEKEYPNIDKDRIYLIGYSMGGSTAQNLMALSPKKFAALISIAGVPDLRNASRFKNKSIWLIHGIADDENPYIGSETLFKQLNGNKDVSFTTFTNLTHNNILIPFLLNDELHKWLFDKKLK